MPHTLAPRRATTVVLAKHRRARWRATKAAAKEERRAAARARGAESARKAEEEAALLAKLEAERRTEWKTDWEEVELELELERKPDWDDELNFIAAKFEAELLELSGSATENQENTSNEFLHPQIQFLNPRNQAQKTTPKAAPPSGS
jgi:hypothetical protein